MYLLQMSLAEQYLPILGLIIVSILFVSLILIINFLANKFISYKKSYLKHNYALNKVNNKIYNDKRLISNQFIKNIIIFIIFGLQMIYLIPCAFVWEKISIVAKLSVGFFIMLLIIELLYAQKKEL